MADPQSFSFFGPTVGQVTLPVENGAELNVEVCDVPGGTPSSPATAEPHTRDRVVYFREAVMDSSAAQEMFWRGECREVSDLLLAVKYGRLADGTYVHPEERLRIVRSIATRWDVSPAYLLDGLQRWSEVVILESCGHTFEWTTRGVVIPGHPRWRRAARARTQRARARLADPEQPRIRLDVYGRSASAPVFDPQSLTDRIGGAICGAIRTAGKSLGEGVAQGVAEHSSEAAANAVEGAAAAVEERVASTVTRVFEAIVNAFESIRSQIARLLGATSKAMRFFVDFIVKGGQALAVWAISKVSGIGSVIIRGVADMLGFDFSDVDLEEGAASTVGFDRQSGSYWSAVPGAVAKALLAAIIAAVVPKWGGPVSNWRSVVDVVSKTVPFTVGVSSMVEWVIETLQWCINCFIKLLGGTEVRWYRSRAKETAMWLARSYDYMSGKIEVGPEEFMLHYQLGADLAKTAVGSMAAGPINAMLQAMQTKFVTAQNAMAYAKASRPEPVAVVLQGDPGIGKSLMTTNIHNLVTLSVYPRIREEFAARIDSDNPLDLAQFMFDHTDAKHWNGYDPDKALTFRWDDVGKVRPGMESATKETETEMLMCIVNTAGFNLEYADVESKGKYYFRSPLVLMTTNLNKAQWEDRATFSLTTPDALMRRLQIFLHVSVAPEWKVIFPNGKLDVAAYNTLTYAERDSVYVFEGTAKGEKVRFTSQEQLARFIARTMRTVKANFAASAVRARQDAVQAMKNMSFDDDEEVTRSFSSSKLFTTVEDPAEDPVVPAATEPSISEGGVFSERRFMDRQSKPDPGTSSAQPSPDLNTMPPEMLRTIAMSVGDQYPDFKDFYEVWRARFPEAAAELDMFGLVPETMEQFVGAVFVRGGYDPLRKPPIVIEKVKPYDHPAIEFVGRSIFGAIYYFERAIEWVASLFGMDPVVFASILGALPIIVPVLRSVFKMVKGFFFPEREGLKPESATMAQCVTTNTIRNMYAFGIRRPGGEEPFVRGKIFFVKGQYALMPYHFLTDLAEDKERYLAEGAGVTLKSMADGKWIDVEWSVFDPEGPFVVQLMGHDRRPIDLAVVRIGGREHRDMTGVFRTAGSPKPLDITIAAIDDDRVTPTMIPDVPSVRYKDMIEYRDGSSLHVDKAVYYDLCTKPGFCGSMLVSQGECGRSFVVGMHVAGDGRGVGAAACFTVDQIKDAISALSVKAIQVKSVVNSTQTQDGFVKLDPQTKLDSRAVARSVYPNGVPDKPGAPPSMVASAKCGWSAEVYESHKVPANCTEAAVEVELEKYAQDRVLELDSAIGPAAFLAASAALDSHGMPKAFCGSRVLSNIEAWTGVVNGIRVAEPINNRTSTGYPFQNLGHVKTKMVTDQGVIKLDSASTRLVFEAADQLLEDLVHGKVESLDNLIFKVSPKRELRPPEKGPRVIQCAPMHVVLVWRRLFWEFMHHYSTWAPEKELGIGLDPRRHWNTLAEWLRERGCEEGLVGAGDYSQFDQCQEPVISRAIGDAVIQRYGRNDRHNRARRLLWRTACGPRIIFRNIMYQLEKGMPSGHPATSIINGLYNCTLFRLCYTSLKRGALVSPVGEHAQWLLLDMKEFAQRVRLSVTGDDNIFASTNPAFNEQALPSLMARFGARYTLDTKKGMAAHAFRPLEEVSYLGRAFRREAALGYTWVAPLRLESIALMAQYAEKPNQLCYDWYASTHKGIVEELSFHPQDVWNRWMPVVNREFEHIPGFEGVFCEPVPWETEVDRMVVQLQAAPLVPDPEMELYE